MRENESISFTLQEAGNSAAEREMHVASSVGTPVLVLDHFDSHRLDPRSIFRTSPISDVTWSISFLTQISTRPLKPQKSNLQISHRWDLTHWELNWSIVRIRSRSDGDGSRVVGVWVKPPLMGSEVRALRSTQRAPRAMEVRVRTENKMDGRWIGPHGDLALGAAPLTPRRVQCRMELEGGIACQAPPKCVGAYG